MVDDDYIQAMIKLNEEYPGATIDDSLKKFVSRKEKNKKKFTLFVAALITDLILFLPWYLIHYSLLFEINNFITSFLIYLAILIPILAILFLFLGVGVET
jgi:hypothetical protein